MIIMPEISEEQLDYFIEDERQAIKTYKKYGLYKLARDEARHKKYLTGLKKKQMKLVKKYGRR
jgi:hypothetical protein